MLQSNEIGANNDNESKENNFKDNELALKCIMILLPSLHANEISKIGWECRKHIQNKINTLLELIKKIENNVTYLNRECLNVFTLTDPNDDSFLLKITWFEYDNFKEFWINDPKEEEEGYTKEHKFTNIKLLFACLDEILNDRFTDDEKSTIIAYSNLLFEYADMRNYAF